MAGRKLEKNRLLGICSWAYHNITIKGGFCGACNRQLAEDEYHLYIYNVDRYWFICNSSKCKNRDFLSRKYYYEVDQKPNSHYTNGVKDYGY